jgi:hypothetical protein
VEIDAEKAELAKDDGSDLDAERDEDGLGVEEGSRRTQKMMDPRKPSPEEVAEHEMTHLPYRNWCRHCIKGRGREMPHKKSKGPPGLPEAHFDFCFLGRENEPGETLPILVVR